MTTIVTGLIRVIEFAIVHSTRAVLFIAASPNYLRKPKRCPKITDKLLLVPARELASMIRRREISSETIVTAYISRIKLVNPILNAVVEDRFDLAIKEAKLVDDLLSTTTLTIDDLEQKYPLLGLPLTVKESIAVEGCSNTSGVVSLEPHRAIADAPIVKLCKEAGAIPIALTNTPELCINFESYNNVVGVTKNPYDTRRTSAGSSGGEGALLGAAASVIGLGSDLFGSIRIPAHFCGVWGHKPSPNSVPITGHVPNCESNPRWKDIFTMGPMCRYATDLSLLMKVILQTPLHSLNGSKKNVDDIKVYYMDDNAGSMLSHTVDPEILQALTNLISHLSTMSTCKKIEIDDFGKAGDYTVLPLLSLTSDMTAVFDDSKYIKGLLQYLTCTSKYSLMTVLSSVVKHSTPQFIKNQSTDSYKKLDKLKNSICSILGSNGVLILPTHPTPATFHKQSYGKFDDYVYTGIFNFLGLPVTQCPLGLTSKGLPIGVQVVSIPDNDGLTITIAEEIEKKFGGWTPPLST